MGRPKRVKLTASEIEAAGGLNSALSTLKKTVTDVELPEGTFDGEVSIPANVTLHGAE